MRVLFLDIDGVLNSATYYRSLADGRNDGLHMKPFDVSQLDPTAVSRLERVVTTTNCEIVISSAWRIAMSLGQIARDLRAAGLRKGSERIIDKTPVVFEKYSRGKEIALWLAEHRMRPHISSRPIVHAIVDDDFDAGLGENNKRFVRTRFEDGLLDEHADKLIELLMEGT